MVLLFVECISHGLMNSTLILASDELMLGSFCSCWSKWICLQFATKMATHCPIFKARPCMVGQPTCLKWPHICSISFTGFIYHFLFFHLFSVVWTNFCIIFWNPWAWEASTRGEKKITSIQTGFCVGSEISWKKSLDYVLCSSMLGWA